MPITLPSNHLVPGGVVLDSHMVKLAPELCIFRSVGIKGRSEGPSLWLSNPSCIWRSPRPNGLARNEAWTD
jgi:hypothetical protein